MKTEKDVKVVEILMAVSVMQEELLSRINQIYYRRYFQKTQEHCKYIQSIQSVNNLQKILKVPSLNKLGLGWVE